MKLPEGVKIRSGNRTYQGECPDKLVTEKAKKQIQEHEKRKAKGLKDQAEFNEKRKADDAAKRAKKLADKKVINDALNPKPEKKEPDEVEKKTPTPLAGNNK
jgi:hypothetical protein